MGSECHSHLAAQKIAYDYIDKVFISHLHVDHFGDLASFWLGGTTMNRLTPLRIWGPSGPDEMYGTQYALDGASHSAGGEGVRGSWYASRGVKKGEKAS